MHWTYDEDVVIPEHYQIVRFLEQRILCCLNIQGLSYWDFNYFLRQSEKMTGSAVLHGTSGYRLFSYVSPVPRGGADISLFETFEVIARHSCRADIREGPAVMAQIDRLKWVLRTGCGIEAEPKAGTAGDHDIALPYIGVLIIVLLILTFAPGIVLLLPKALGMI